MCLYPLNTKFSVDLQTPKNATLLIGEGKRGWGEFVLGIGLRCVRLGEATWLYGGLGNSFSVISVIGLHFDVFLP